MKLVAAKCPSCGADIDVDKDSDSTKCEFCNSKIIVEDAIQKLKVEISGEVSVKNMPKLESLLKNADRYYTNNEWDDAYKQYNKAIELDPDNYEIVLRNGISKFLANDCDNYNTLDSAINEAIKLIDRKTDSRALNQIATEGFMANNVFGLNSLNAYKNGIKDYDETKRLNICITNSLIMYSKLEDIASEDDIRERILKSAIDLAVSFFPIAKRYNTGIVFNGTTQSRLFKDETEGVKYSIYCDSVTKYNYLVPITENIKMKSLTSLKFPYNKYIYIFIGVFVGIPLLIALIIGIVKGIH